MASKQPVSVLAIVAGGRSSRMGQDKATLDVAGETVLARTVRIARGAGFPEIWAVGRDTLPAGECEIPCFPDTFPGRGPLEGIATALRRLRVADALFVLPCDLPLLTVPAVAWMRSVTEGLGSENLGWTLETDGNRQPLVSVWAGATLEHVESSLQQGSGSVGRCADTLGIKRVPVPAEHRLAFTGANTPAEWRHLMETAAVDGPV